VTETITDFDQVSAIIEKGMSDFLSDHRTAIPVKVKKFDKDKNTVDVEIIPKELLGDDFKKVDTLKELPVINLGNKLIYLTIPIKEGDEGIALFMDRSIDDWENGFKEHRDNRVMDISDGVFVPMQLRYKDDLIKKYNEDALVIRGKCCDDLRFVVNTKKKEITAGFVKDKNTIKLKKDEAILYTNDEKTKVEVLKDTVKVTINDDLKFEIRDSEIICHEKITFKKKVTVETEFSATGIFKAEGSVDLNGAVKINGTVQTGS